MKRIADEVWQFAEPSLLEIKSAQLIIQILQEQGFTIKSKGTAGVPTAFIAEYGDGTPTAGFLVEYDALPGLGNEPVPYREPRKDQVTSGHGCGHNLLGAGSIGAAIALKNVLIEEKLPGTIRVYGCAAEETEGAALATQTTAKVLVYTGLYDLLPNSPLAERMQANLEKLGVPTFTKEEQAFAREIQQNYGVEPEGMALETMPLGDENISMGFSTDVG